MEPKERASRDIGFIIKAGVIALLLMAVMHIINPILNPPREITMDQVTEVSQSIVSLRANETLPLLRNAEGKHTLMVVYASWCPACRMLMPNIMEMIVDKELDHMNRVFFSLDTDYRALAVYLLAGHYEELFTPYIVKASAVNSLEKALSRTGSSYNNGLPYIAVFDAAGQLVDEDAGVVSQRRLRKMTSYSR